MIVRLYAVFRGHEPVLSYRMTRRTAYYWVVEHADELAGLLVDCGLNTWSWNPDTGWLQTHTEDYTPGQGAHPKANPKCQYHGNDPHARHPWRFCMQADLTPNPLANVAPTYAEYITF